MAFILCQKWFKKPGFLSKTSKFGVVWTVRFCSSSMWYKHFLRNVSGDFRLLVSTLAKVVGKCFNCKFTAKNDVPIGHFRLSLLLLTFEQNRVVQTIQNYEHFDKKWLCFFDKVLTPCWKTFL